jgi:hypothetical protein
VIIGTGRDLSLLDSSGYMADEDVLILLRTGRERSAEINKKGPDTGADVLSVTLAQVQMRIGITT